MAEIIRYGAYLPAPRAPLGEIHAFFGRPGRPRAKALAIPALDEDALTMAYEASREALGATRDVQAVVVATQSPPFGMRKLSATLGRALSLDDGIPALDLSGHAAGLLDALAVSERMVGSGDARPVLVVATDYVVSYEDRVCDLLSGGAATAFLVGSGSGFCRLGPQARAREEVYDVWHLGREAEPRYRLEVLFDAYGRAAEGAIAALATMTERETEAYQAVCPSQPHPQALRALSRAGVSAEQISATSFVAEVGNLGAASVGVALALGLDGASRGDVVLGFGYGGGEGIAQSFEVVADPPAIGTAGRLDGDGISLSTYYRWTKGRQAEPH